MQRDYRAITKQFRKIDDAIFKFMMLLFLFFCAISPVFRNDMLAKYVGFAGSTLLAILVAITLFKRPSSKPKEVIAQDEQR